MLKALFSKLGLQPKNLTEASEANVAAKTFADSVNALFAEAGLNLEQLLEAGPAALKAHIDSLGAKDGELAAALAKINELETAAGDASATIATLEEWGEAASGLLESIGFQPTEDAEASPEAVKAAFASHVKKAAALELAKAGHPAVAAAVNEGPKVLEMSLEAFNALNSAEKMKFAKAGGRLTS